MPNLSTLPTWVWIAAAVVAYLWAKKNGYIGAAVKPSSPAAIDPSPTPTAPAQVVEIRHNYPVAGEASATAAATPPLTEIRRVSFDFDVEVTPRPKASPP